MAAEVSPWVISEPVSYPVDNASDGPANAAPRTASDVADLLLHLLYRRRLMEDVTNVGIIVSAGVDPVDRFGVAIDIGELVQLSIASDEPPHLSVIVACAYQHQANIPIVA